MRSITIQALALSVLVVLILCAGLIPSTAAGKQSCEEPEKSPEAGGAGTSYVRWGRTECPQTASLVYQGIVGKGYYSHTGGGTNYICLYGNPEWPIDSVADFQHSSYVYGVEYQQITAALHDHGVPCAVCHVTGRGDHLMIPAKMTCPQGWTKEYAGMLVSERSSHQSATFECLDNNPQIVPNSAGNEDGGLFYRVEAACGHSLPCPPFVQGYEVPCVVCTM